MSYRKSRILRKATGILLAGVLVVSASAIVRGATSTNYELLRERTPAAAGDAFSTNYHLVGMAPQQPSGDVRTSTNYELETIFVPQTFEPIDTVPPVIQTGPSVVYISDTIVVIEWTTDELADGDVDYGTTTAYGSTASQAGGFSILHQVVISGLTASTTYDYRVGSTDPYSNGPTQSANAQFTTLGTPDTAGPVISETITPTSTQSVDISFTTSEFATTDLSHGTTAGLGTSLPDSVFRDSHTRSINGLTPGATHFYEISATDPAGNASVTGVQTFVLPDDVAIAMPTLPSGQVGSVYTFTLSATGGAGALTWTVDSGSLPPGIMLIGATGELSGIPTTDGTFNFDIRATDSGTPASTDVISLQLDVSAASSGGGGGGGDDDEACTTGTHTGVWMMLCALLALMALTARQLQPRA